MPHHEVEPHATRNQYPACAPRGGLAPSVADPNQPVGGHGDAAAKSGTHRSDGTVRRTAGRTIGEVAGKVGIAVFLTVAFTTSANAECAEVKSSRTDLMESIGLVYDHAKLAPVVDEAVDVWTRCANYGEGFPQLRNGSTRTRTLRVGYVQGGNGRSTCGSFQGNTIILYAWAVDPRSGRRIPCGAPERNLAHEIGHALGLRDAPKGETCDLHIMAALAPRTNQDRRTPQTDECRLVGERWTTLSELLTSVVARRSPSSVNSR